MRRYIVRLRGQQVPSVFDADRQELVTTGGEKYWRFLAGDIEVRLIPEREIQDIGLAPVPADVDEEGAAPPPRHYPLRRV